MNNKINRIAITFKWIMVIVMIVMLGKLTIVAIVQKGGFQALAQNEIRIETKQSLPRGKILDHNGEIIVDEKIEIDLNYIESNVMTTDQKEELAKKISKIITLEDAKINETEFNDFVLTKNENLKKITSSFSEEEKKSVSDMSDLDYNKLLRSKITEEQSILVKEEYTNEELFIILEMRKSTSKTPMVIKNNISEKELYQIELSSKEIGGFYIVKDYIRNYPHGNLMKSFLGTYGEIPEEEIEIYEAKGYERNAKVGTTYLEKELEEALKQTPETIQFFFDKNGNISEKEITESGKIGNNAYLTIDLKMQKIAEEEIVKYLQKNTYKNNKVAQTTILSPNDGRILVMAGKIEEDGKIVDNAIGNFTQAFTVGSSIKPAILAIGLDQGVVQEGEIIVDEAWNIKGTPTKKSYKVMGPISDLEAISWSSNIYFYTILLRLAGGIYEANQPIDINTDYFEIVRNYLEQFGLGSSTGIKMKNENIGFKGSGNSPGLYIDLANGQYDTYTNLQQAQYASTLENNGTRHQMQYLDKVNTANIEVKKEQTIYQAEPNILNELQMDDKIFERIREGMNLCLVGSGTCNNKGFNLKNTFTGKTGTSESFYYDNETKKITETYSSSLLGTYHGNVSSLTIASLIPDYGEPKNASFDESGDLASSILNRLEKEAYV